MMRTARAEGVLPDRIGVEITVSVLHWPPAHTL
jgi:hypothetical protein